MEEYWYVLRSKPNKEETLWREVRARGYEIFFPQIHVKPVNPRSRKIRPYFPGYMFVRLNLATTGSSALAWLPYSCGLVSFGAEPLPIHDELVNVIRLRLELINTVGGERLDQLHTNDEVTIQAGLFEGYQAIFDSRLPGNERVRVLLKLLNMQQISLVLPMKDIKKNKTLLRVG